MFPSQLFYRCFFFMKYFFRYEHSKSILSTHSMNKNCSCTTNITIMFTMTRAYACLPFNSLDYIFKIHVIKWYSSAITVSN